jgi:hypothetical protein
MRYSWELGPVQRSERTNQATELEGPTQTRAPPKHLRDERTERKDRNVSNSVTAGRKAGQVATGETRRRGGGAAQGKKQEESTRTGQEEASRVRQREN